MDKNSCSPSLSKEIIALNHPHFFTSNGDCFNYFLSIKGLSNLKNVAIFVFYRYGKLIKQVLNNDIGWYGTFNGQLLPAHDYWIIIDFEDNNTLKTF